jgi:electron transfer flavoprotein beta subunit
MDITFPFDLDPETFKPLEADIFHVVNPADLCATQAAVKIRESKGGEVILVSFGPPRTQTALRTCLALGGDRAISVWDEALAPYLSATAHVLAKVMTQLDPDLILCGSSSLDEGCGEVGATMAEYLDLPQVTGVVSVDFSEESDMLIVQRKLERGRRMSLECPLPAIFFVEPLIEQPLYASFPGMLEAAQAELTHLDAASLGIDMQELRTIDSKRRLARLSLPRPRPKKSFTFESGLSAEERMELIMSGGLKESKSNLLEGSPEDLAQKLAEVLAKKLLE